MSLRQVRELAQDHLLEAEPGFAPMFSHPFSSTRGCTPCKLLCWNPEMAFLPHFPELQESTFDLKEPNIIKEMHSLPLSPGEPQPREWIPHSPLSIGRTHTLSFLLISLRHKNSIWKKKDSFLDPLGNWTVVGPEGQELGPEKTEILRSW